MSTVAVAFSEAQNIVDPARYGSSEIIGTARYRSMAGAFGALGGDPSCMNDNPAGLSMYRTRGVFTITPHLSFTGTESKGSETMKMSENSASVSNCAVVFTFRNPTSDQLVNCNLGLGFQRHYANQSKMLAVLDNPGGSWGNYLANQANSYLRGILNPYEEFNWNSLSANLTNMTLMAWFSDAIVSDNYHSHSVYDPIQADCERLGIPYEAYQDLYVEQKTRDDYYNLSFSANWNDVFYLGATVTLSDYSSILTSEFAEHYVPDYSELSGDAYTRYDNKFETKGTGFGVKVGAIWNPVDNLRLGAAVHTPMFSNMHYFYDGIMDTDAVEDIDDCPYVYDDDYFKFNTPWEYQLSGAYIFGTRALLSLEYNLRDFSSMKYKQNHNAYYRTDYTSYNNLIQKHLTLQHTLKAGMEYRMTPQLSVRAGYAYVTSPFEEDALKGNIPTDEQNTAYYSSTKPNFSTQDAQYYLTCGLGWSGANWFADFSFMYHNSRNYVAAYPGDYSKLNMVELNVAKKDLDLTIGYRF